MFYCVYDCAECDVISELFEFSYGYAWIDCDFMMILSGRNDGGNDGILRALFCVYCLRFCVGFWLFLVILGIDLCLFYVVCE